MKLPALLHGRRRRLLARLALNGVLQAAVVVAITHAIRASLDAPAPHSTTAVVGAAAALGALAAGAMALLRWIERVDAESLAQSYVFRVRTRLLRKLERLDPETVRTRSHGGLLLRFAGDLTSIGQWVGRGLARLVVSGIVLVAVLVAVALLHWSLALAFGLALLCTALAAQRRAPRLDAAVRTLRAARARLGTRINATLNHLPELDATGGLPGETARLGRRARAVRGAAVARAREIAAVDATAEVGAFAIPVAVLCAALAARDGGVVTQGEVVAVLGIALLVTTPIRDLGRAFDYWRRARIAREQIERFLALPERGTGAAELAGVAS